MTSINTITPITLFTSDKTIILCGGGNIIVSFVSFIGRLLYLDQVWFIQSCLASSPRGFVRDLFSFRAALRFRSSSRRRRRRYSSSFLRLPPLALGPLLRFEMSNVTLGNTRGDAREEQ
jgi:hypothetical protein